MADNTAALRYDVVIIGGGVVGAAIALELSRYNIKTALLEKDSDVGQQTSSRNSGVSHAGFNYTPGSLRARLGVRGNEMLFSLTKKLGVEFDNVGKLTVARTDEDLKTLHQLLDQGKQNGVPDLAIVDSSTIEKIQPGAKGIAALYSPSSSIINPYQLTINMAQTAQFNDVDFFLNTHVIGIDHQQIGYIVRTGNQTFTSKVLINCAGLFADQICAMLGINEFKIYPCKGEYWILDRAKSGGLHTLVYPTPRVNEPGLGIHLTPTTRGNIMIGPSAQYTDSPEDYSCTTDVLNAISSVGHNMMPALTTSDFIRHFSGLRPKLTSPSVGGNADFVVEERANAPGFIITLGIESPGLTAAPAIAQMVLPMVGKHLKLNKKPNWSTMPLPPAKYKNMSDEERIEAVAANPNYGDIVCRCEQVTRAEIIAAYNNPLGATSLRSIKMRTGAMMGRCQSGFCLPKLTAVLREEFGILPKDITGSGKTHIFTALREKQP
jgi:glycerol-3-phosphate dehydrogenase